FLRVSAILQLAGFALLVLVYFLQPGFTSFGELISPRMQRMLPWLPSYWFLAWLQELNGPIPQILAPIAGRARIALAASVGGAAASFAICYFRTLRKIAEEPDILPSRRARRLPRLELPRFGASLTTAVARFSLRTLARSRQHRVIFSFFLGV